MKVSENTSISMPIRNMLAIVSAVAVGVWAYFGVIERLNFIEQKLEAHWEEIEENDNWIDEFQPPKAVQDTVERVRELEIRIVQLETIIEHLK